MRYALLRAAVLLSLAPSAAASQLAVDGQTQVVKTLGESVVIALTGAPLKPAFLLADVSPGPTTLFSQSLPLGFTPALLVTPLGVLSPFGVTIVHATLPANPALAGITVYLLGVVVDPAATRVFDFSNGASVSIAAQPPVLGTQGTVVGRKVLLSAASYAKPDGNPLLGTSVTWSLLSTPSGSVASIANSNKPYATLVPDKAGDYLARATLQTPTFASQQDVVVHAWQVQTTPYSDGGVSVLPSLSLSGTIAGPPVQSATLDGQPLAVAQNGAFGPLSITFPDAVKARRTFRMQHADGTIAVHRMTLFQGIPQTLAATTSKSLAAQINQPAIDQIEALGEQELAAADIEGLLLSQPPQQVANETGPFGFTIFSATIDFTNLAYDPNVDLQLVPTPSGVQGVVTIKNVKADFKVTGEVLEVGYSLNGYITTNPTTIQATLVGSAQNGKLKVTLQNVVVNRQNFDFELNGFIGTVAEAFVIESAVKEDVEAAIASAVQSELPPAMEAILNSFTLAGSLASTLDVDVTIAAPISGVVHSSFGVTLQLDGKATPGVAEPGSPPVPFWRATPSSAVVFAATTPTGLPYGAALALADDFVNQILAAATAAGLLDGDLTSIFPNGGQGPVTLATDQLAILFPGNGFDAFPVGTPVTLRAHGTVPPILVLTPGGPTTGKVLLENLEVEFEVPAPYGPVPLLRVALSGDAQVSLGQQLDGTLAATVGATTLVIELLRPYPGSDFAQTDGQTQFLGAIFGFALPELIAAIGSLPLPSLEAQGLSLLPTQIAPVGPQGSSVGFFGNLVVVPPGG